MTDSKIQELEKRIEALEKGTKKARPKRAPSGYALFVKEQLPIIMKDFPSLTPKERLVKCGQIWKERKSQSEG